MEKLIKKIISIILYLVAMYFAYNIFMPEHGIIKKGKSYVTKQENIIQYEKLMAESETTNGYKKYHLTSAAVSNEAKVRFACQECHTDNPHKEIKDTRAFFNMHSAKISCLTCHIDKKDKGKVKFGWFDNKENLKENVGKITDIQIAPYIVEDTLPIILEADIKNHEELKSKFNVKVAEKARLKCKSCHIKKGRLFLDLSSLGYSDDEIKRLRNLDEADMYDRKEQWIYPDFL
jgi:transposase-like protein